MDPIISYPDECQADFGPRRWASVRQRTRKRSGKTRRDGLPGFTQANLLKFAADRGKGLPRHTPVRGRARAQTGNLVARRRDVPVRRYFDLEERMRAAPERRTR